jgi:hypothetical protein
MDDGRPAPDDALPLLILLLEVRDLLRALLAAAGPPARPPERTKLVLDDADLVARWECSLSQVARHRARGLRAFRLGSRRAPGAPGPAGWRYRLEDVQEYERRLVAEAQANRPPEPEKALPPIEGWDGVRRQSDLSRMRPPKQARQDSTPAASPMIEGWDGKTRVSIPKRKKPQAP